MQMLSVRDFFFRFFRFVHFFFVRHSSNGKYEFLTDGKKKKIAIKWERRKKNERNECQFKISWKIFF